MPGGVRHSRIARRDSTVLRQRPSSIKGCGHARGNRATETVSRLQSFVATDSEDVLRPSVGEGRNICVRKRLVGGVSRCVRRSRVGWFFWRGS